MPGAWPKELDDAVRESVGIETGSEPSPTTQELLVQIAAARKRLQNLIAVLLLVGGGIMGASGCYLTWHSVGAALIWLAVIMIVVGVLVGLSE